MFPRIGDFKRMKVTKFYQHGLNCGKQIAEILKKKFPEATVYALYRSAVAILYDQEEAEVRLIMAGDPHVMGRDISEKSVEEIIEEYRIVGNRYCPEIVNGLGLRLWPEDWE